MEMIYYNHFNINPEKFRSPQYNISPFSTEYVRRNYSIINSSNLIDHKLLKKYFGEKHHYFINGKSALYAAINQYDLNSEDEVYIITTTGNKYISSCVTNEIEKKCKWSRRLTDKTKLILVNHEFGMVCNKMKDIRALGLPIIEDMAMSMFSTDLYNKVGEYGDFTIFSLPKFFPIQFGGVLKVNSQNALLYLPGEDEIITNDLKKLVSFYLKDFENIKAKRKYNHHKFYEELSALGIESRFQLQELEIPSVFMFKTPLNVNNEELKLFLQLNGIEASVFYGEDTIFVPVHQNLEEIDIKFMVSLIEYFFNANK